MVGWYTSEELKRIWKQAVLAWSWCHPDIYLEETSVRIADVPIGIRTEHLPITNPECYLQTNLFRDWLSNEKAIEV
jgi:hypothetical protein